MSNVEQMEDNLSYMKDFRPLNPAEQDAIRRAQEVLHGVKSIPCTACHYCTNGCPMQIPIPEIFAARNKQILWGQLEQGNGDYAALAEKGSVAGDCIACGQCESACPQQIDVSRSARSTSEDKWGAYNSISILRGRDIVLCTTNDWMLFWQ